MTKKDKAGEATPDGEEANQETGKRSLIRRPLDTLAGIIAEACRVYGRCGTESSTTSRAAALFGASARCAEWSRRRRWSVWNSVLKNSHPQSKARHMATRQQIDRLSQRIEELASRFVTPPPPPELWIVDGDRAYQRNSPEHVITVAELEARPMGRGPFLSRIVRVIVDPVPEGPGHRSIGSPRGLMRWQLARTDMARRFREFCSARGT